jgi:hypothetical protein
LPAAGIGGVNLHIHFAGIDTPPLCSKHT